MFGANAFGVIYFGQAVVETVTITYAPVEHEVYEAGLDVYAEGEAGLDAFGSIGAGLDDVR